MPERAPNHQSNETNQPEPKKISRRNFIIGAAATIGAGLIAKSGGLEKAEQVYKNFEHQEFLKDIEKEKSAVLADIQRGLDDQSRFEKGLKAEHALISKRDKNPTGSTTFKQIDSTLTELDSELERMFVERGSLSYGPLGEANRYAEALKHDQKALEGLSTIRVLYSKVFRGYQEYDYWHNLSAAYLELGKVSIETIQTRFKSLLEYAKEKDIRLADIPVEQILYCMIDPDFDFSLQAQQVEKTLLARTPEWKNTKPTHVNKDSYDRFNDLSQLDIFELNRLSEILTQMSDKNFVRSTFKIGDLDIRNTGSEIGGVIPMPSKARVLEAFEQHGTFNGATVVDSKTIIASFHSAAQFHFHATEVNESADFAGPSGGDDAFFAPGVVFSSKSESSIVVHFFASRIIEGKVKNEVIYLGELRK